MPQLAHPSPHTRGPSGRGPRSTRSRAVSAGTPTSSATAPMETDGRHRTRPAAGSGTTTAPTPPPPPTVSMSSRPGRPWPPRVHTPSRTIHDRSARTCTDGVTAAPVGSGLRITITLQHDTGRCGPRPRGIHQRRPQRRRPHRRTFGRRGPPLGTFRSREPHRGGLHRRDLTDIGAGPGTRWPTGITSPP